MCFYTYAPYMQGCTFHAGIHSLYVNLQHNTTHVHTHIYTSSYHNAHAHQNATIHICTCPHSWQLYAIRACFSMCGVSSFCLKFCFGHSCTLIFVPNSNADVGVPIFLELLRTVRPSHLVRFEGDDSEGGPNEVASQPTWSVATPTGGWGTGSHFFARPDPHTSGSPLQPGNLGNHPAEPVLYSLKPHSQHTKKWVSVP